MINTMQWQTTILPYQAFIQGSLYSVDWTTGLDYWTGILDSPLTQKIPLYKRLHSYREVGDHLLKLTLFHTNDTFSQCIISMEIDLFFAIFCFQVHHIKKNRPASLSLHHQLCTNTKHTSRRSFVSLPILRKNLILAYMEKSGVSRFSALISREQRLARKKIGHHQEPERMEIHREQER